MKRLSLLLLLLLIAACASSDARPSVSFLVFGDAAELAAYEQLVAAFTEKHPDINLELGHIPDQGAYRQRLASDFASGNTADVFLLNYRRFARFAGQGGIEPLGGYLDESELIGRNQFFPVALNSFTWDNTLWCIPQNVSSLVVYYNRDLFDAAGVPYPTDSWTWDDFVSAAQQLTVDSDGNGTIDQYGVAISPSIFRLAPFVWQMGGDLVDDPANPTALALATGPARDALEQFVALQTVHGVVPDRVAESAETSQSRFLNGRLAMIFNSRRGVPTYRTIDAFTWDVAPLPQMGPTPAGILHSDAYCMSATAEHKDAVWTFIEYANSAEGQRLIATSGRTVPSLVEVADSAEFLDPTKPPANARVFVDTVPQLRTVPVMQGWVGIEELVSAEIDRAFYGNATLDEAIEAANRAAAPYLLEP